MCGEGKGRVKKAKSASATVESQQIMLKMKKWKKYKHVIQRQESKYLKNQLKGSGFLWVAENSEASETFFFF